jgi:hypothetical protein
MPVFTDGITRFCIHLDSWFRQKSRIGGTKAIDPVRVDALLRLKKPFLRPGSSSSMANSLAGTVAASFSHPPTFSS